MAISTPVLVNGTWFDTGNRSQYNTNVGTNTYTVSLVAGRRYYLAVASFSSGAAEAVTSVVHDPTGTPLAFSLVSDGTDSARITGYGSTGNTIEVWECNVTSTTATAAIRITYAGGQSACGAGLWYLDGEDDTNTSVQVKLGTGSGTLPAPATMSTFGATDNLALLVVATESPTNTISATESRTKLYENNETERNNHAVFYQNPHGGDVSLNASITSDSWAAIGIEIRAAGTGAVGVSGTDSATVTDTRTGFTAAWQTVDTGTVAEAGTALAGVSASDAAALSEALTALTNALTATDSAALTETAATVPVDATATDTATLTEALATETVDVVAVDAFAVAESQSASLGGTTPLEASEADSATVAEALTALDLAVTAVADVLTLTDAGAAHFDIVASDSLTVTEAIATIPLEAIAADAAALSEALGWTVAWAAVETVTVTDAQLAFVPGTFAGEPTMGAVALAARIEGGP